MGKRAAHWGLGIALVFASGCRETVQLVTYEECNEGYTNNCVSAGLCKGVQKCGPDHFWGPCVVPPGNPLICEPPTKPECDVNAAVTEDKPCYTGPEGTKWKGICRPGYQICKDGKKTCAFQQTPQFRNCSNGIDNDCDGFIDSDQASHGEQTADVVLFVDESGSMVPYMAVIKQAIVQFANSTSMSSDPIRIAAVGMPHGVDGTCGVITDFTDPVQAGSIIDGLMTQNQYFSFEPTIDCPFRAAGAANDLHLSYRAGIKRIFISFTDEGAQSYPEGTHTASEAGALMAQQGIQYFSFDTRSSRDTFEPMTRLTGGSSFELKRGYAEIQQDLVNLLLRATCRE